MSTRLSNFIPATQWRAVVEEDGKPFAFHFAAWALRTTDDGDGDTIVGLAPGTGKAEGDVIDDYSNFAFYIHDDDPDGLDALWRRWKEER